MPAHSSVKASDNCDRLYFVVVSRHLGATRLRTFLSSHLTPSSRAYPEHSTTTTPQILDLTPVSYWARRQLHSDIGFIPTGLLFIELYGWQFQDSKGNYSTTAERILILFVGGCWARCQLHAGMRYISVGSRLRKSLLWRGC